MTTIMKRWHIPILRLVGRSLSAERLGTPQVVASRLGRGGHVEGAAPLSTDQWKLAQF